MGSAQAVAAQLLQSRSAGHLRMTARRRRLGLGASVSILGRAGINAEERSRLQPNTDAAHGPKLDDSFDIANWVVRRCLPAAYQALELTEPRRSLEALPTLRDYSDVLNAIHALSTLLNDLPSVSREMAGMQGRAIALLGELHDRVVHGEALLSRLRSDAIRCAQYAVSFGVADPEIKFVAQIGEMDPDRLDGRHMPGME